LHLKREKDVQKIDVLLPLLCSSLLCLFVR
jgi:hypothetical protein